MCRDGTELEVVGMNVSQVNGADRRVKRTHKLLQDALLALLSEKTFQLITVQDIAERADVNRATFYAHFVDKYALLDHLVGEMIRQELARRVSVEVPVTAGNFEALIVTVLETVAAFNGRCKTTDRDINPLVEARVQLDLESFLLEWLGRAQSVEAELPVSRETAASVLSWAIFGAGIAWSRENREIAVDEKAREVMALLSGGIKRWVKIDPTAVRANGMPAKAGRSAGRPRISSGSG
jgi:AcrR family transcriptional regulator